jgi:hypothetical protein
VIQNSGQSRQIWYRSISFRLVDEIVTYSFTSENAATLAAEMERRAPVSVIKGCVASEAFFRFLPVNCLA